MRIASGLWKRNTYVALGESPCHQPVGHYFEPIICVGTCKVVLNWLKWEATKNVAEGMLLP